MKRGRGDPPPAGRFRPFEGIGGKVGKRARKPGTSAPAREHPRAPALDSDLETEQFHEAIADAVQIERDRLAGAPVPRPARLPDEGREWRDFAHDLLKGRTGFDISWSEEYVEGRRHEVTMSTMKKLRGGHISWQAYLDLHGMNRDEARKAVEELIRGSRLRNQGCVLVVHGRGKGSEGGVPVLKEKLVAWLTRESGIGSYVLAFATARRCDGGPGAVYVLLRQG